MNWLYQPLPPFGAILSTKLITASDSVSAGLTDDWRKIAKTDVAGTTISEVDWQVYDTLEVHLQPDDSFASKSATDSLTVGLSDATPSFGTVSVGATESLTVQLTELPVVSVTLTATDSLAVQLSEAQALQFAFSATDSLTVQLSDATPTVVAVIPAADSLTVGLTDNTPTNTDAIGATESLTIGLTDGLSGAALPLSASDSLTMQLSEAAALAITYAAVESLAVQLTESSAVLIAFTTTDSLAVQLSDATPNIVQSASISATDSLTIGLTESTPIIGQVLTASDSLTVGLSDAPTGSRAITTDDQLAAILNEATRQDIAYALVEGLGLTLDEAVGIASTLSLSDTLPVGLTDVNTFAGEPLVNLAFTVSDSVAVGADEAASVLGIASLSASDSLALGLEDDALVDDITPYWGGGAPGIEPAAHVYAGSYRMGSRNPDETRGDLW